jgi:glutathione S-transferase
MRSQNLLVTLQPSSGVDTARWLMSHYQVDYEEHAHAPIFHVLALKWWGVGPEDYALLVEPDNKKTFGRLPISQRYDPEAAADKKLIPDEETDKELHDQVVEMVKWSGDVAGTAIVNWSYFNFLKYKWVVWPSIVTNVPWYEKAFCLVGFPIIRALMYKGLALDQQVSDEALKTIYKSYDRIDALLEDGRKYLFADRLTLADISVAGLFGPSILVQGYGGHLPNQVKCPDFMQKVYKELRQRPTGLFIQRMYDEHRAPRQS